MNTSTVSLQITSIIYDNMDTKVLINAETIKDHLSYESQYFVNFSELNHVLNQLQSSNDSIEVSSLFEHERLGSDYSQYVLNATQLTNRQVSLHECFTEPHKKQIRA